MLIHLLFILVFMTDSSKEDTEINESILKLLVILQDGQESTFEILSEIIKNYTFSDELIRIEFMEYKIDDSRNDSLETNNLCSFYEQGYNIILDFLWNNVNSDIISTHAQKLKMLHLKIDLTLEPTLKIVEAYLNARNGTDISIIFESMENIEKALSSWINYSFFRATMLNGMSNETYQKISETGFVPSFYVIIASTQNITIILNTFKFSKIMNFPDRLILVFLDMADINEIKSIVRGYPVSLITYDKNICCITNNCENCPNDFNLYTYFLKNLITQIIKKINKLHRNGLEILSTSRNCSAPSKFPIKLFYEYMNNSRQNIFTLDENNVFHQQLNAVIEVGNKKRTFDIVAKYNNRDGLITQRGMKIMLKKKFYRISSGTAVPWIYREVDPGTGQSRNVGYCVDFIEKLAEVMDFNYELSVTDGPYGAKLRNGSWNGFVEGLITGQIDIVVGPMTVTAEREEVIDFVTPVFASSGISIVTRKPLKKASLFNFLTVFDYKVWLVLIAAVIATALMLFVLDYCSPFSSKNTKYPHICREFNIRECFWFILTSFTPQGGGEPPKALSGRILVGTYWIFVILLLATFTANLSVLLTVERTQLQAPDYTLDQLIRQSRINYSVVKDSWPLAYFKNMRNTENDLYGMWKSLSLNASTDKYRVWEYPIKEIYGNVLKAIHDAGLVENASEGYRKVLEHTDGDFAFIHDYAEIRHATARICNLVEVGVPFAERPYAIAVQQGSILLEEVGQAILTLQRDGYLDLLEQKYWKANLSKECLQDATSDGISFESLGGVFIITIAVLTLAIISLIVEIFNLRHPRLKSKIKSTETNSNNSKIFLAKKDLFEKDIARNEATFEAENKLHGKFMEPQVTLGSHLHLAAKASYNRGYFREPGVTVVRNNYFTVNSRRPLHLDKDLRKHNVFLN